MPDTSNIAMVVLVVHAVCSAITAMSLAGVLWLDAGCATVKQGARAVAQDAQPCISWLDSAQAALTAVADVVEPLLPAGANKSVSCGLIVLADAINGLKAASAAAQTEDANVQWQRGVEAASSARQALVDAGVQGI